MAELLKTLKDRAFQAETEPVYRPIHYRLPADADLLKTLIKELPHLEVHDRIGHQLRELVKVMNPTKRFSDEELQSAVRDHLDGQDEREYGCWVHYPWSGTLVHLLDAEEFALVRTDRNRNKITREEQQVLAGKRIGVIGLSVGQSVSLTMALERTFGEIRLADYDTLDLSNLNRLRSATRDLGLNKAVITAREIAEIDPYLKVHCFLDGLTMDNMDAFFTEGGPLDLLVEECDSIDIKILAREKARELGIPVVMDMSDRGCLDVERFDLEPERPLMHGWIDHLDLEAAKKPMSAEEKVPYMLPITGVETLSPRMKASVIELGQTISTWPQLATSVILGGALAGDVIRRVFLGEFTASGRWFVDLEELVSDPVEPKAHTPLAFPAFTLSTTERELLDRSLADQDPGALELTATRLHQLIKAAGAAPSKGNRQPWKFAPWGHQLGLLHDRGRSHSFWDPDGTMARLGLGACIENIVLQAQQEGLVVRTTLLEEAQDSRLVATFSFYNGAVANAEPTVPGQLALQIPTRCTNRRFASPQALPDGALDRLERIVAPFEGISMHVLRTPQGLAQLAAIHAAVERIRLVNPKGHHEHFVRELRWTLEEAERTGDGLLVDSLEPVPAERAALKMFADPRAAALTDRWHLGHGLGAKAGFLVQTAPAMILLAGAEDSPALHLAAGRAMQRIWLAATQLGLSIHPLSSPIQMMHAAAFPMEGLRDHERETLERLHTEFNTIWALENKHPFCSLRIFHGGNPSARSPKSPTKALILPSA